MTRTLEAVQEIRARKLHDAVVRAIEFELVGAVAHNGGELTGFSVRLGEWETLVTLRATFPAGKMICFVGSETLAHTLLKCVREAQTDKLVWRADKFAEEGHL